MVAASAAANPATASLRTVSAISISAPLGTPTIMSVEYGSSCVANAIVNAAVAAHSPSMPRRLASIKRIAGTSAANTPTVRRVQTYAAIASASAFCGVPKAAWINAYGIAARNDNAGALFAYTWPFANERSPVFDAYASIAKVCRSTMARVRSNCAF